MESERKLVTRRFILYMVFLIVMISLLWTTMGLAFAKAPGREPEVQLRRQGERGGHVGRRPVRGVGCDAILAEAWVGTRIAG